MVKQKYGAVYTPDTLSEFVAILLKRIVGEKPLKTVLDPASDVINKALNILGSTFANKAYE